MLEGNHYEWTNDIRASRNRRVDTWTVFCAPPGLGPMRQTWALNEWGEFAGGYFTPLFLLWLVLGYFQQGDELRLNTDALKAQQEELRQQVEATGLLAEHASRQADASERLTDLTGDEQRRNAVRIRDEAQPVFHLTRGTAHGRRDFTTNFENAGGEARDIELEHDTSYDITFSAQRIWRSGQPASLVVRQRDVPISYPLRIRLSYADRFGDRHVKELEFLAPTDFREV